MCGLECELWQSNYYQYRNGFDLNYLSFVIGVDLSLMSSDVIYRDLLRKWFGLCWDTVWKFGWLSDVFKQFFVVVVATCLINSMQSCCGSCSSGRSRNIVGLCRHLKTWWTSCGLWSQLGPLAGMVEQSGQRFVWWELEWSVVECPEGKRCWWPSCSVL